MGRKSTPPGLVESNDVIDGEISIEQLNAIRARVSKAQKVRRYPDEVKMFAITLQASGYSYRAIGELLGVGNVTVHNWVNDAKNDQLLLSDVSEQVKSRMSNKLYITSNNILSRISDKDVEDASLVQKTTAIGTLIDKARLIDGETTDNISMVYQRKDKVKSQQTVIDAEFTETEGQLAELKGKLKG